MTLSKSLDTAEAIAAEQKLQEQLLHAEESMEDAADEEAADMPQPGDVGSQDRNLSPITFIDKSVFESRRMQSRVATDAPEAALQAVEFINSTTMEVPSLASSMPTPEEVKQEDLTMENSTICTTMLTQQMVSSPMAPMQALPVAEAAPATPSTPGAAHGHDNGNASSAGTPVHAPTKEGSLPQFPRTSGSDAGATASITLPSPLRANSSAELLPSEQAKASLSPQHNPAAQTSDTNTAEAGVHEAEKGAEGADRQPATKLPSLWAVWMSQNPKQQAAVAPQNNPAQPLQTAQTAQPSTGWTRHLFRGAQKQPSATSLPNSSSTPTIGVASALTTAAVSDTDLIEQHCIQFCAPHCEATLQHAVPCVSRACVSGHGVWEAYTTACTHAGVSVLLPEGKLPGKVSGAQEVQFEAAPAVAVGPIKVSPPTAAPNPSDNACTTPQKSPVSDPIVTGTITPCTVRSETSVYGGGGGGGGDGDGSAGAAGGPVGGGTLPPGLLLQRSVSALSVGDKQTSVETLEKAGGSVATPFDRVPTLKGLHQLSLEGPMFDEEEEDQFATAVSQPVAVSRAPTHVCTNVMDMCMTASKIPEGGELSLVNQELRMPEGALLSTLSSSLAPVPVSQSTSALLWPRAAAVTQQNVMRGLFSLKKGEPHATIFPIHGGQKTLADMDLHLGTDGMLILGPSCNELKFRNVAFFGGMVLCTGNKCNVVFEDVCFTHCTLVAMEGSAVTLMHAKFNNLPAFLPQAPPSDTHEASQSAASQPPTSARDNSFKEGKTEGVGSSGSTQAVLARPPPDPPRDRIAIYAHGSSTKVTAADVVIRGGLQGAAAHDGATLNGVRLTCIAVEFLGVEARGSSDVSLRSCIFRNILKYKQSSSTDVNSTGILLHSRSTADMVATKTRNCGVGLVLRRAVANASECQFVAGGANCMHVFQQSRLTLTESLVAECLEGNGLLVSGDKSSAQVRRCRFMKNKGAGLCVAKDAKVEVTSCLAYQNGTCGFLVSKSRLQLQECECVENRTGVSAQTTARLIAERVTVKSSTLGGFHIFSSSADLKNCVAESCAGDGVNVSYALPAIPSAHGIAKPVVTMTGGRVQGNGECGVRSYRSVMQGQEVKSCGNRLCGFMAKGEEAHITLRKCKCDDDLTYKEKKKGAVKVEKGWIELKKCKPNSLPNTWRAASFF